MPNLSSVLRILEVAYIGFHNLINPLAVVRYLCVLIQHGTRVQFPAWRHQPIGLSTFTDQRTTRVSLKAQTQYVVTIWAKSNNVFLLFLMNKGETETYITWPRVSLRAVHLFFYAHLFFNKCYICLYECKRKLVFLRFSPARDNTWFWHWDITVVCESDGFHVVVQLCFGRQLRAQKIYEIFLW